jgi:hypothetical protein
MKRSDVQLREHYIANVSGKRTVVRIDTVEERFYRGVKTSHYWLATNLVTGRQVHISSPQRLQKHISPLTAETLLKVWKG